MSKRYLFCITLLLVGVMPLMAHATARLISVTSVSGGCVSGPTGPFVQSWDVEPGETYHLTIADVVECGNGGTDPTINVRINSTDSGNFDLVATYVSDGVYEFDFTVPAGATCTMPIFYCTVPGDGFSGIFVVRDDGAMWQAHLRAATFDMGCTNPMEIIGPSCGAVPVEKATWSAIKALYN